MDTSKFILDLRALLQSRVISQAEISRRTQISQGNISKIVRGKKSILFSTAIKLWPFIYGREFPLTATPTTPPESEHSEGGGDAA